jgi:hypothetical protein
MIDFYIKQILCALFLSLIDLLAIKLHSLVNDTELEEDGAAEYDHAESIRVLESLDYRWRLPSLEYYCLLDQLEFFL